MLYFCKSIKNNLNGFEVIDMDWSGYAAIAIFFGIDRYGQNLYREESVNVMTIRAMVPLCFQVKIPTKG